MNNSTVDTMSNEQTQEESAMPLEESTEQTTEEATGEEAAEVEEAAGTQEAAAATDTEAEANTETEEQKQPSKLEKAFTRTKEENRQLKSQTRDLQNQISEMQAAETNRTILELGRLYGLTKEQTEILKRAVPEEREAVAKAMQPWNRNSPMLGTLPNGPQNKPRTRQIDSIPTFKRS